MTKRPPRPTKRRPDLCVCDSCIAAFPERAQERERLHKEAQRAVPGRGMSLRHVERDGR